MAEDRTLIDGEPGVVIYDSATIVFDKGITMKIAETVQATPTDVVENAGDTWDDARVIISGQPSGEYENLTKLFPYASYRRGQNIFGADKPLVIHTTSGKKFTVGTAALTKSPDITLNPDKPVFGGAEWTGIRKKGVAWATADSLYKYESAAFASWAAFDAAAILKVAAAAAWGALASPWDDIRTTEGWVINFGLNLKWITDSSVGSCQALFMGETVMAKCAPLYDLASAIIAAQLVQGTGARRGKRVASGSDLVLTGEGGSPEVTLTSAALRNPGYQFGGEQLRVGELGFEAQRTYSSGQPQPLYTLA